MLVAIQISKIYSQMFKFTEVSMIRSQNAHTRYMKETLLSLETSKSGLFTLLVIQLVMCVSSLIIVRKN